MFGFRRPKFVTKCKTDIKGIKVRLETIKKKRNSVLKYLKNDIADLLKNGLDPNAYGRAEGVLVEQNMSACYQLTESFVDCISSHLSLMQNQSECPEECKEAVASVMYAAARFSDLPELRDLRNVFTEKYGDSLQVFVNKELVDNFKSKPPSKEMKIQLMHDIAREYSIDWDSKALEQKLFTPPPANKACESDDNMYKSQKKNNAPPKRTAAVGGDARKDASRDKYKLHSSSDDEATDMSHDGRMTASSSVGSRSEDEAQNKVPSSYKFTAPPYYKSRPQRHDGHEDNAKPKSVRRGSKPAAGGDNEEERERDGLLMHYSQKKSPYDSSKVEGNLKPHNQSDEDTNESTRRRGSRPASRGTSMKPPEAHVHPKLPEYDELATRIAALRGN